MTLYLRVCVFVFGDYRISLPFPVHKHVTYAEFPRSKNEDWVLLKYQSIGYLYFLLKEILELFLSPSLYIWPKLSLDSCFCDAFSSVQFSSVTQSCPTLCNPMNRSTPGFSVHHRLPEFTQTHVHWIGDAIQLSHPLSSPSPPAPNPSQHQSLFQWVNSSHEVAKVLEFQL